MARILLIDDDDQVRGAIRRILERAGYTVVDAPDGAAGIRAQREQPADVIITDIFMPQQDGIETIRQLRRERSIIVKKPLVAFLPSIASLASQLFTVVLTNQRMRIDIARIVRIFPTQKSCSS